MLVAATGSLRRFATLFAMVAVSASIATGCGGGGSSDSVTVNTATRPEAPVPSAAAFVGKIEKADPEQTNRLCRLMKAKGESAAFASFKKGYALAFPNEKIPPKKVFDEIIKHCG
jgi:hypothetical protein